MCMSVHEEVIGKLNFVAHRSGAGSGGTRNISGTTIYHKELEHTLSGFIIQRGLFGKYHRIKHFRKTI